VGGNIDKKVPEVSEGEDKVVLGKKKEKERKGEQGKNIVKSKAKVESKIARGNSLPIGLKLAEVPSNSPSVVLVVAAKNFINSR